MTDAETFDRLHERALMFMGAFSSLQLHADSMVDFYLRRRMPDLGKAVVEIGLKRRRDEDRLRLVRALAAEVSYSELYVFDDGTFSTVFNRCKQLRDLLGHSVSIVGPVYGVDMPPHVGIARLAGVKTDRLPDPILPSLLDRFAEQTEWLTRHVLRVGFAADPDMFVSLTGELAQPELPGNLPHPGD